MLDLRARSRVAPILDPIAVGLSKMKFTPTIVTIIGLLVTLVGAGFIAVGRYALGGFIAGLGATLDALDGPLARYQGTVSTRGAFVDTMSDRFGEVGLWAGLTFSLREDETGLMLCVLALAFSLLTPYVRSKAESWGAEGRGGWMGRAERMILMLVGLMVYDAGLNVLHPMLWTFVVLAGFTVMQRCLRTWQQLGEEDE